MSLNCNEINLVLEELKPEGTFIQDIIQPGFDTLALYTYGEEGAKTILICVASGATRIHETRRKIPKNEKPLRFMEFLKSRIKGAKIVSCRQIGFERIIRMELSHGPEEFIMYIRLWSNAGNIILCDKQLNILDTMFRRPNKNEVSGGVFSEPVGSSAPAREFPVRDFLEIEEEYLASHPEHDVEKYGHLSFNQKIDLWYGEHAQSLSREALLEKAQKWYEARHSRQLNALERLKEKQRNFALSEQKKHQGDLILTYAHLIESGKDFIECEDYESGKTVRIKIDPKKSAHENAAVYYETYKKEASGYEELINEIEVAQKKLEALEKAYNEILNEPNPVRIEQLLRKDTKPKQQEKKTHPGLDYTINGWYILVGRDANENDELLRHHVKGSDMWLHVRDFPGGYVFIKYRAGKTVPLEILLDAANLAIYYSKARSAKRADLYYTQVKYLRRAKNGPKGLVIPTQEKNLSVELDPKRLARLDAIHEEAQGI